jgi:hypothetical protein
MDSEVLRKLTALCHSLTYLSPNIVTIFMFMWCVHFHAYPLAKFKCLMHYYELRLTTDYFLNLTFLNVVDMQRSKLMTCQT